MTRPAEVPLYIRAARAKEFFDMHRTTVYELERKGLIKIYRTAEGYAYIKTAEVAAWIEGVQG
jgi:hypothetical protein